HHIGDVVLKEFAARIRRLLTPEDVFARFGGDEFALYVERTDPLEIRRLGERILGESYTAIGIEGLDVVVTSSIGIAAARGDDRDAAALLRRADIAMYTAKQQHAGCESYSEGIDRRTPERLTLLGDLRQALDRGLLVVHYQPKVDLVSSAVVGVEALVRWQHETRGWVPPEDFIPLAEESGLIRMLTDQVLGSALAELRRWHDDGFDLTVAVNLSTLDLLDELLVDRIARHLEMTGLRPENLVLEITESSLMVETPRVMATIQQLDRLGVGLSLDDFGTGFSSLSYLRRLPVTELKIDRSFVGNLLLDPQDEVIVKSTIDLGHNLNLRVVAEGIENGPIFERLRLLGCDLGQGYGISRPLPADLLSRWLVGCEFATSERVRAMPGIVETSA
ncbi:MAG: bifunctional diguanylate cyclase/phosphodiesterase, partial [Ilumatobacter sp.]